MLSLYVAINCLARSLFNNPICSDNASGLSNSFGVDKNNNPFGFNKCKSLLIII